MEPSTIIVPRITDIGKMKHDIRIDLGLHFALEDIIDSRFAEKVIRYLQSHDLIRHYSDYEIVFSKNDARLLRSRITAGKIGRFKVRHESGIWGYNVWLVWK